MRQVVLYQGEDGYWVAEVPSLPGCVSQGRSRDDALKNAAAAAKVWIESVESLGEPIPDDPGTMEVAYLPGSAA